MYHPYKSKYSVRPQLEKLTDPAFHFDFDYDYYIDEKRKALTSQKVHLFHECDHKILYHLEEFVKEHAPWVNPPYSLHNIAMQVQEDIAIHRVKDGKDWLAATHICFPSSWRPEEKIGKSFAEIHSPVPGMDLRSSYKIAQACTKSGPFRRFVWSPIFENKINFHPNLPKAKFNPDNPYVIVKVEKQITWPLPQFDAFIFLLRQYLVAPDLKCLYRTCSAMDKDQKKYKGIEQNFLDWMEKKV